MIANWKSIKEKPNDHSLVITKTLTQQGTVYCICIFDGNIFYSLETGVKKYPDFWDDIEEFNNKNLFVSIKDSVFKHISKFKINQAPGLYS